MVSTKLVDACQTLVYRTMLAGEQLQQKEMYFGFAAAVSFRTENLSVRTTGDAAEQSTAERHRFAEHRCRTARALAR